MSKFKEDDIVIIVKSQELGIVVRTFLLNDKIKCLVDLTLDNEKWFTVGPSLFDNMKWFDEREIQ